MSKLVFDAIGKYVLPTRYCQIVETQSLCVLTSKEQRILSENQNHSSAVAKVHYQKQRSREVAVKAHECLQRLKGAKGSEVDNEVITRFSGSESSVTAPEEATEAKCASITKDLPLINQLHTRRSHRWVLKFISDEDAFLKKGIRMHDIGQWTAILRDSDFTFQKGRTADSLKKRAELKFRSN